MKNTRVDFSGTGMGFLGFLVVRVFLIIITLGLYLLVFNAAKRSWKYKHTKFDGQGMLYDLSLFDWILHSLIDWFLILITLGIYTPWAIAKDKAYAMEHSSLADGRRFRFMGSGGEVIVLFIISVILLPITGGLALPWILAMWKKWEWDNTEISSGPCGSATEATGWNKLRFDGTGTGLAGTFIINYLLSLITLGIYSPWAAVNVMGWEAESVTVS